MNNKKIILHELKKRFIECEENKYTCTQSDLFEELWLKNNDPELLQKAKELDIPKNFKMCFYANYNRNAITRFQTLIGLYSRDEFKIPRESYICRTNYFIHLKENGHYIDREPTEDEIDLVLKVRCILSKEFNEYDLTSIAKKGLHNKYNKRFIEEMKKLNSNIEYIYEVYNFLFLKDIIREEYKSSLKRSAK